MQRAVQALGSLAASDREIGPCDVAHEQRVAGQEHPGIVGALEIGDRDAAVLGPVARGVEHLERHLSEHDAIAVLDRVERILGAAERMRRDPRAERGGQDTVAGHVVRVRVRLDHTHQPQPVAVADVEHRLHVQRRVDDDRLLDVLAADHVRGTAEIVRQDLLENHPARILQRAPNFT